MAQCVCAGDGGTGWTGGVADWRLCINFSTGMGSGDGPAGTESAASEPEAGGGEPGFRARNGVVNFSAGAGWPAGIGRTSSGVTITIKSVLVFDTDFD